MSRRRPYSSATAPSPSVPLHLQARIRLKPARGADKGAISQQTSPLPSDSLSPTRRPPKTPLLHHNESSLAAQQRYGSVFVIAGGCGSAAERLAHAESQRACAAGGRGSAAERRVHVRGIARAHAAALEASLVRSHAHVLIKKRLARPCMEVFVAGAEDAFALHA